MASLNRVNREGGAGGKSNNKKLPARPDLPSRYASNFGWRMPPPVAAAVAATRSAYQRGLSSSTASSLSSSSLKSVESSHHRKDGGGRWNGRQTSLTPSPPPPPRSAKYSNNRQPSWAASAAASSSSSSQLYRGQTTLLNRKPTFKVATTAGSEFPLRRAVSFVDPSQQQQQRAVVRNLQIDAHERVIYQCW